MVLTGLSSALSTGSTGKERKRKINTNKHLNKAKKQTKNTFQIRGRVENLKMKVGI
jgi:hypothetical protein